MTRFKANLLREMIYLVTQPCSMMLKGHVRCPSKAKILNDIRLNAVKIQR